MGINYTLARLFCYQYAAQLSLLWLSCYNINTIINIIKIVYAQSIKHLTLIIVWIISSSLIPRSVIGIRRRRAAIDKTGGEEEVEKIDQEDVIVKKQRMLNITQ